MKIFHDFPMALVLAGALCFALLPAASTSAQQTPPKAEISPVVQAMTPGAQHAYLASQVGTWKASFWVWTDASASPITASGTLERTMILGDRVLQEEIDAQIMGLPYTSMSHVGYDNVTKKYWATSFDSLSTGVTTLEGEIDEATGKATFIGSTPEATAGRMVTMRLEIYNEDGKQVTESYLDLPGKGEVLVVKTVYEKQ